MNKPPLTVIAALLMAGAMAAAEVAVPPTAPPLQDRTAAETDKKEVARAISSLKPNRAQFKALLAAHKAALNDHKAGERSALEAVRLDFRTRLSVLRAAQAAEENAMRTALE